MPEPRSVLRGAGYGRVLVFLHDAEPVGIRPRMGELALLVDARLVLRMGGEAIADNGKVIIVQLNVLTSCNVALPPPVIFCV